MLIKSDPKTAGQNPLTSKPDITPDTIINKKALMINVKRPRLRIFIGRVRSKIIGLKNILRTPRIAAAKKALKKPAAWIPSIK